MELLKYIMPVVTFVLGALFTIALQKKERKRAQVTQSANEIARLSNDWYEQICDLVVLYRNGDNKANAAKEAYAYVQNRKILPNYLRQIEILKQHPECKQLSYYTDLYVSLLTNKRPERRSEEFIKLKSELSRFLIEYNQKKWVGSEHHYMLRCSHLTFEKEPYFEKTGILVDKIRNELKGKDNREIKELVNSELEKDQTNAYEILLIVLDKIIQDINREAGRLTRP